MTLGLVFGGKISLKNASLEILAQLLGAFFLSLIFPEVIRNATHLKVPALGQNISADIGIFTEVISTCLLTFVVYATIIDTGGSFKSVEGFGIGCVILFDILAAASIT
ncbi:MAG: aquaporin [Parachlamydiaceae bacterium]